MKSIEETEENTAKNTIPYWKLGFLILVGSSLLAYAVWYRLVVIFRPFEYQVPLHFFNPAMIKKIGCIPNEIEIGLHLQEFKTFDIIKNDFSFFGIVWFSFDPDTVFIDVLSKFDFLSATIDYKSPPIISIVNDKIVVKYYVRVSLSPQLTYVDFPLDDHYINLTLINIDLASSDVLFQSTYNNVIVSANLLQIGWDLVDRNVRAGYIELKLDTIDQQKTTTFPAVTFTFGYSRLNIRDFITLMMPLLLIFHIILFTAVLATESSLFIIPGAVMAMLGYRFVIDAISPHVGYFMLIDTFFIICLFSATLILFIKMIETSGWYISPKLVTIISILLYIFMIVRLIFLII